MKSFIVEKYANHEIRFGFHDLPPERRQKADNNAAKEKERFAQLVALTESESIMTPAGGVILDYAAGKNAIVSSSDVLVHRAHQSRALDLIGDFQRTKGTKKHDNKPGWGHACKATKFGSYARHTLREAGAVAERRSGHLGRGVEVTLTLPGSTHSAYRALSEWSGYIVNLLLQTIRRSNKAVEWFYVWEVQGRGALHLHLALTNDTQDALLSLGEKIRESWFNTLEAVSRKSGIDLWYSGRMHRKVTRTEAFKGSRVAEVEKGLCNYFAKYLSKNASKNAEKECKYRYYPARWWGINRTLLRAIKDERVKVRFTGVSEQEVIQLLDSVNGWVGRYNPCLKHSYTFDVSYCKDGHEVRVGSGFRQISWIPPEQWAAAQVWLPQLLNHIACRYPNATIHGDIRWLLHTTVEFRCMQSGRQCKHQSSLWKVNS